MKKKEIPLTEDKINKIAMKKYLEEVIQSSDNSDVDINHLEKIFTDGTYYKAMKIVPLLERKVLYLYYVENCRLNEVCKRLKLSKNEVVSLKSKGIIHFKNNLKLLYKINNSKIGGNSEDN